MRFLRRSLVGLFLLSVTVGLLAYAGQMMVGAINARLADGGPPQPARERVFSAKVALAEAGRVVPLLTTFGEVRSRRTLELRAPSGGRIVHLAPGFEDGAAVAEGQVLLRLDPADAQSALDRARVDLAAAEAEGRGAVLALDLARDELASAEGQVVLRQAALTRQEEVRTRGAGSDAAVETAALALSGAEQSVLVQRGAVAQAEARVDIAANTRDQRRIALAEAERALADTELRAGFAGTLSGVSAVAGGIASANERIGDLIDPDALEVSFRLSTATYSRLIDAEGRLIPAPVEVALEGLGAGVVTTGTLSRVGASVGEGLTGRLVYAALAAPRGFRPGDFVTVRVQEPALEGVMELPATALGAAGTVLVLGADDRLEEVPVELVRRQGDSVILRAAALTGREVVTERSPLLGAGIKVKPVRPEAAAAAPAVPVADAGPDMVELSAERRAVLVAFVEGNTRMPADAKARVLDQLAQDRVPAQVIARLEQRMGG